MISTSLITMEGMKKLLLLKHSGQKLPETWMDDVGFYIHMKAKTVKDRKYWYENAKSDLDEAFKIRRQLYD